MAKDFDSTVEYLKLGVTKMLEEQYLIESDLQSSIPSDIWQMTKFFRYLLELSPENLRNIRCHGFTIWPFEKSGFFAHMPEKEMSKYEAIRGGFVEATDGVPDEFLIGEPRAARFAGPLGKTYRSHVMSGGDRLRYQYCVSNLYHAGILQEIISAQDRRIVAEIGGGYGGLAHNLSHILKNKCTYIIIDLPEILMVSGTYLALTNSEKSIYIYDSETFTEDFLRNEIKKYDFVLIPHFVLDKMKNIEEFSLLINMCSFAEMTSRQVNEYLKFGFDHLRTGYLYSENLERYPLNDELVSLTDHLSNYFELYPNRNFYEKEGEDHRTYLAIPKNSGRIIPDSKIVGLPKSRNILQKNGTKFLKAVIPRHIRHSIRRMLPSILKQPE